MHSHDPRDWVDWVSLAIQIVGLISIVAYTVVTYKLFRTSQQQFESTVKPGVDISLHFESAVLRNVGTVPIANLEIIALLAASYRKDSEDTVIDYQRIGCNISITRQFRPGEQCEISLTNYQKLVHPPTRQDPNDHTKGEACCYMIRYRRAVDMQPFLRFISFGVIRKNDTSSPEAPDVTIWPFQMAHSTLGGPAGFPPPYKNLRIRMEQLCREGLDS